MKDFERSDNPYLLLTPGPLTTTRTVKATMLRDWCTWDDDYNAIIQKIRARLIGLAGLNQPATAVLMQGSGTFSIEATIGTALPADGKLLVLVNGAYGQRMAQIAAVLKIPYEVLDYGETCAIGADLLDTTLLHQKDITHVALVHCETTTGMLNPVETIADCVRTHGKTLIVDAMSSFGGIPVSWDADFLVSSANKCIQGVPGFGFIIAGRGTMEACAGQARSLSLDLFEQWKEMENGQGKWRFTSPTHVVRAFARALEELDSEGGIEARHERYRQSQQTLVQGMRELGFRTLLPDTCQSPIITSFISPTQPDYQFKRFYQLLKERGFVIYPGKVTVADTFRVGNIGDVHSEDINRLLSAVSESMYWKRQSRKRLTG